VVLPWLLLAAPVVAAILFIGTWVAFALCLVVALAELQAFRQTERFSSRVWRAVGKGTKGRQARGAEVVYLLSAVAGVLLLVVAVLTSVG
jgi:hypothetical protein